MSPYRVTRPRWVHVHVKPWVFTLKSSYSMIFCFQKYWIILPNKEPMQGSDQFISFNSIQFQFKLDSGFFNSIQFQFKSDSESFNSIPIQFIFIQFQFNSIQILCTVVNKSIRKHFKTGSFKFNLSIPLFAAQFRKYMQDHNKSRIN